ncbi:hypothetical protein GCM10007907_04800 [Chitinimonas prasina]|uniref:Uncharacterized protein n=1 Tax=Chitinimonas prasina TaxID=1434937 RepID=A0ABQ5Y9R8_9NEIS|nr:hypothetical protein GCM10007907_04800 [Chitinimonas prasina]
MTALMRYDNFISTTPVVWQTLWLMIGSAACSSAQRQLNPGFVTDEKPSAPRADRSISGFTLQKHKGFLLFIDLTKKKPAYAGFSMARTDIRRITQGVWRRCPAKLQTGSYALVEVIAPAPRPRQLVYPLVAPGE